MLHGMYGPDYNFKMDNWWYCPNPCSIPLTYECAVRFIQEHFFPGMKTVGNTTYIPQLLGNDFFYSDAPFTF